MSADDEQPALDFEVSAAVSPDERIAREEIEAFYAGQVAEARAAYEKAAADLAAAEQKHTEWRSTGEIVSTNPASRSGIQTTVWWIVERCNNRVLAAMKAVLRPALDAPTTPQAIAELGRLHDRPETPDRMRAVDEANDRLRALRRWLTAQGHDPGPIGAALDDDGPGPRRPRGRR